MSTPNTLAAWEALLQAQHNARGFHRPRNRKSTRAQRAQLARNKRAQRCKR